MTYENALEWAIKHAPPEDFDSFEDWYNTIEDKLNAPYLFSSPTFNRMVEREWIERFGSLDASSEEPEFEEDEEIIQSGIREVQVYDNRDLPPQTVKTNMQVEPIGLDLEKKSLVPRELPQLPPQEQKAKGAPIKISLRIPDIGNVVVPTSRFNAVIVDFASLVKRSILGVFRR